MKPLSFIVGIILTLLLLSSCGKWPVYYYQSIHSEVDTAFVSNESTNIGIRFLMAPNLPNAVDSLKVVYYVSDKASNENVESLVVIDTLFVLPRDTIQYKLEKSYSLSLTDTVYLLPEYQFVIKGKKRVLPAPLKSPKTIVIR